VRIQLDLEELLGYPDKEPECDEHQRNPGPLVYLSRLQIARADVAGGVASSSYESQHTRSQIGGEGKDNESG